jgi:hypothetical protein
MKMCGKTDQVSVLKKENLLLFSSLTGLSFRASSTKEKATNLNHSHSNVAWILAVKMKKVSEDVKKKTA